MNLIRNFESTLSQTTDSGGVGELRVLQTRLKHDVGLIYGEVSVFSLSPDVAIHVDEHVSLPSDYLGVRN